MNTETDTKTDNEITTAPTLMDVLKRYIIDRKKYLRPGSMSVIRAVAKAVHYARLSSVAIPSITDKSVTHLYAYLDANLSENTATVYKKAFVTFLRWCTDVGIIITDSALCDKISTRRYVRKRPKINLRPLTVEEIKKVEDYKPTTERLEEAKAFLLLACATGMKSGELVRIPSGSITKEGEEIVILASNTRWERRPFTLTKTALKTCEAIISGAIPVYPLQNAGAVFRDVCLRSGITDVDGIGGNVGYLTKKQLSKHELHY